MRSPQCGCVQKMGMPQNYSKIEWFIILRSKRKQLGEVNAISHERRFSMLIAMFWTMNLFGCHIYSSQTNPHSAWMVGNLLGKILAWIYHALDSGVVCLWVSSPFVFVASEPHKLPSHQLPFGNQPWQLKGNWRFFHWESVKKGGCSIAMR